MLLSIGIINLKIESLINSIEQIQSKPIYIKSCATSMWRDIKYLDCTVPTNKSSKEKTLQKNLDNYNFIRFLSRLLKFLKFFLKLLKLSKIFSS